MSGRAATDRVIRGRAAISVNDPGHPLPKGWARARLTDVADLGTGHTPSRNQADYWDGDIPWIGIRDAGAHHGGVIRETLQNITTLGEANSAARLLPKDTVCLSRTASVGYVVKMGRDMATSQDFVNWSCSDALNPDYLLKALVAEGQDIRRFGEGSTHTTIYFPEVKAFHIDLPPLAEQRRIVAKLDALTARLSRARKELDRVPLLADRLRETAITAAFQGWERRPLEEVSNDIRYGFTASAEPVGPGSKFLRITDIHNRQVDWSRVPFVQPEAKDIARCGLRTGDIVFARSGATVGKSFLLNDPPPDAVFASYLIRVRVNGDLILPQVAAYYFQSGEYWEQIKAGATGTGQPNFNGSKLAKLLVPVGSRQNQSEAVRLIELAFARADRLEAEAAKARALLDRMEAAILARAFRGELVPQDPADEPASVLLDRIRTQRAAAPKPKRGRRKKVT